MANFRSKPVLAPPLEKIWRDGLRDLVSGGTYEWAMGSGGTGMAGRHTHPSTPEYPFGTVLKHRDTIVHEPPIGWPCACRMMAGLGPEQGFLLSWPADPKSEGQTSYYFKNEWEPTGED